ncbi:hypothetical protein ANDROMEDA_76 [Bacillus phage Andromeda]|uniref:Uncharacterized protein n=2 Tax=Andromedavirus andromeda TaxID=1273739 RepID=M1IF77_9CAUD|nr:hypothetical protein I905_gp76 [Bacillus phage Andromeda]AGE60915.1 hypothetical protein GEMINI_76 [Bacillus phage Gemini]AGE61146.1 hypothetical protein ANDROMEDA_76 [Bacillus phage Andromeda]
MGKYRVKGYYMVTQYVDRIVEADNPEDAESKAQMFDFIEDVETEREEDTEFVISEEAEEVN